MVVSVSPAEARDALERAFPGTEWTVATIQTRITGERRKPWLLVAVDIGEDGRFSAWVSEHRRDVATSKYPARAVRQAIANVRARLTRQIAALDAATETP